MNQKVKLAGVSLLLMAMAVLPTAVIAADQSTFESFYKGSTAIGWVIGALVVIAGGALLFYSGGTASPIVAGMGTWVGSLMGYSGIAATNAGLALLGGGSIASGGLGMLGGATLLTAALSFGTGATVGSAVGTVVKEYSYSKFIESSKQMTALPLPKNPSGPADYGDAFKTLKKINDKESIFTDANQTVIRQAIRELQTDKDGKPSKVEAVRSQTLLALLQFSQNDYAQAKKAAKDAYELSQSNAEQGSLAVFIYSASILSDKKVNFADSLSKFRLAVSAEPKNPLTPVMFAVYLDRVVYRLNDNALLPKNLDQVYEISESLKYDEKKAVIQLGLLNRYLIRLFSEGEQIRTLTGTENSTAKYGPRVLKQAQEALKRYRSLISSSKAVASSQKNILDTRLQSKKSNIDFLTDKGVKDWETKWADEVAARLTTISKYAAAVKTLELQIKQLEAHQ